MHVGTSPVCLKRQEKNSRVHTLGLGVLPPTDATTNILVRDAHANVCISNVLGQDASLQ